MNFKKVNNITGWLVFAIAAITYTLTKEARGSLWDCGEFVACAFKLGMPHPPGAPLFTLLGRFFIILFGDNPQTAASAVNFMSAMASAGTILFLFWTITHFARKMFIKVGETLSNPQLITVMGGGVVGALAYTFTDSFWYSAVEGEVYALSSFFTAFVFWIILKWEHADEHAGADEVARVRSDRWIIFLFFMMGLSIGVHLLNLLTIPAIVMIYYYRRYKPTTKGAIAAFIIGCVITGIVQVAVIQYSMKAAGLFDVFFVNSLGMPFFSGFAAYFIFIALLIGWALMFKPNVSKTKIILWTALFFALAFLPFAFSGSAAAFKIILLLIIGAALGYFIKTSALKVLKLSLWCYAFMMLGYFMYFTSMIRSNANPGIDMNNVDNPINLVYYLGREQYGSAPLIYGPHFAAEYKDDDGDGMIDMKMGEMKYVKGKDHYIATGRDREPLYQSSDMQLFPRVWDRSNDQNHAQFYADWLDLEENRDPNTGQVLSYEAPSYADNISWFMSYQTDFLFMRYFMWNFAGRQNDLQGFGNKRDGNWISGISFIDSPRLGDQSKMPESLKENKANNKLFLLPIILGILGFVFQMLRNRNDFIVTLILFFFMGEAIVIYLNAPGNMPRERDYVFVGACYVFAIWIGLSVLALVKLALEKTDKDQLKKVLIYGATFTFLVIVISSLSGSGSGALMAGLASALFFAIVVAALTFIIKALSGNGANFRAAGIATTAICLLVPALMAQQEWDDHDRSKKTIAPDLAKDYLESCAPNAILFTFGDNDTYPLWYAQEVEGIRKDIRIINTSLLGIDWYINQLRYKINDAPGVDVIWTPEQIEGHNREYIRIGQAQPGQNLDPNAYYPLFDIMKDYLGQKVTDEDGNDVGPNTMPFRKFFVPVDKQLARKNGDANTQDSVVSQLTFEVPSGALMRNDLIMLNIIATNKWQRPIYFTAPYGELGFGHHLRKDGLTYRLVPVIAATPQQNWVTDQALRSLRAGGSSVRANNLEAISENLKKFEFGGANRKGVYFDEVNRQYLLNIRSLFAEAAGNLADAGKVDEAVKLLNREAEGLKPENLPYGMASRYSQHNQSGILLTEAYYKAGKLDQARKIAKDVRNDINSQRSYYQYLKAEKPQFYAGLEHTEVILNDIMDEVLNQVEQQYDPLKKAAKNPSQELLPQALQKAADSAGIVIPDSIQ
ncbi:DUF2723 domain-containing protein [Niabella insulamsoli]|uniref:DUF2723 domain-containing protein n=1 Tax=Niabella insulamsoli TaxID=3144874 RepID=UPI0031FDE7AE